MRVLMLGWEFPPYITGGLGTACHGLTRAMSARGTAVTFVLPKAVGGEYTEHVKLLTPQRPSAAEGDRAPAAVASTFQADTAPRPQAGPAQSDRSDQPTAPPTASPAEPRPERPTTPPEVEENTSLRNVVFKAVPSHMASVHPGVYPGGGLQYTPRGHTNPGGIGFIHSKPPEPPAPADADAPTTAGHDAQPQPAKPQAALDYHGDLFSAAHRYADLCLDLAKGEGFDVIHAHDWLTFPAAQALSEATGRPWVAHVHSTEYDRAGEGANPRIVEHERHGLHAADRVIAVSEFTRQLLRSRYGLDKARCAVVYNGVERVADSAAPHREPVKPPAGIKKDEKVVLYLGRITMQKGPEYFIAAAKKVLEKLDKVKFVVAGSGDQIERTIEQAAQAGIGSKITFTGFLRGEDVRKVYEMADVYVMPSVSEPFGIAPLEAIAHRVPVIISRQSGVSEVLEHALKVDFWDTHDIANKIIAVLRHPPLSKTLREHADMQVRELTWDGAAAKCEAVYGELLGAAI